MSTYYLNAPLSEGDIIKLKIGDIIYISGDAFTCRSRLQKYIFDEKNMLPFSTAKRNVLIHAGPIVVKDNGKWRLVSFMPTSSIRFEKWGAKSVSEWDLRLIIGKTTMGKDTAKMMRQKKCVHASPQAVSPNLWVDSIVVDDVYLFDELGTIEAAWHIKLDKLGPFIVDIDSQGNNFFDQLDNVIADNYKEALKKLKIDEDYQFTKLY